MVLAISSPNTPDQRSRNASDDCHQKVPPNLADISSLLSTTTDLTRLSSRQSTNFIFKEEQTISRIKRMQREESHRHMQNVRAKLETHQKQMTNENCQMSDKKGN